MRLARISFALALSGLSCFTPGASFSTGVAPRYIVDAGRLQGPGTWRPTASDVTRAEAALRKFLSDKSDGHLKWPLPKYEEHGRDDVASDIENYTLQFVGARQGPGNRAYDFQGSGPPVILIAGFCNKTVEPALSKHLVTVFDGGDCFFRAVYDPSVDGVIYFAVNGTA
jgi:hypothetical protein